MNAMVFRSAAVVLAANEAQVIAVLRHCHAARIPIVPRGAGTGLSGGVLPHADGVLLRNAGAAGELIG